MIVWKYEWYDNLKAVHVKTRQSQPDDVKKEAAKMLKKINEVAERSENLENQVST